MRHFSHATLPCFANTPKSFGVRQRHLQGVPLYTQGTEIMCNSLITIIYCNNLFINCFFVLTLRATLHYNRTLGSRL